MEYNMVQGQILSLLQSIHQTPACQFPIEYFPELFVRIREWSHEQGAARPRCVTQKSYSIKYITSHPIHPHLQEDDLLHQ